MNRFHHQVVLVIHQVAPQHVADQLDALRDVHLRFWSLSPWQQIEEFEELLESISQTPKDALKSESVHPNQFYLNG